MSNVAGAATWPRVEANLQEDGSAEVVIAGRTQYVQAPDVAEARPQVVAIIAHRAAQLGRPLRVLTRDPEGEWPLIINPDGTVEPDPENEARPRPATPVASQPSPPPANDPGPQGAPIPAPGGQSPVAPEPGGHGEWVAVEPEVTPAPSASPTGDPRQPFLPPQEVEPAADGWRGTLSRMGLRVKPSRAEQAERAEIAAVAQHWPGPRTVAVVNPKGGAGKTPTTVLLAAMFARHGGAGVLAWDNNQTRGTLGWRTEQGPHDSTVLDLLPQVGRLLSPSATAADLGYFVHHQAPDRFDVLRSKPTLLAHEHRVSPHDVDAIHAVACKYYRLVFMDSGNDESDPMWLRMIDRCDQLVVATTARDDHVEAGELLLDALAGRDERSAWLAANAVAVVNQADPKAAPKDAYRVAAGFQSMARDAVMIPFDPAMVDGQLQLGSLRPATQRAWLSAAAAVARGL